MFQQVQELRNIKSQYGGLKDILDYISSLQMYGLLRICNLQSHQGMSDLPSIIGAFT